MSLIRKNLNEILLKYIPSLSGDSIIPDDFEIRIMVIKLFDMRTEIEKFIKDNFTENP